MTDAFSRLASSDEFLRCLPPAGYSDHDRHVDFKATFGTEQGRRVLALILARCHLWGSTFYHGDTHDTAFAEGEREVGLWLMDMVANEPPPLPADVEPKEGEDE